MTMHLAHPALTTTGRKHGTKKWASAQHKQQHQELEQEWQKNMQQWNTMSPAAKKITKSQSASLKPKIPPGRTTTKHIPSIDSQHRGAVSSKSPTMYTGNNVLGIAVQHKSCLQPIFSQESAVDSAHMRR